MGLIGLKICSTRILTLGRQTVEFFLPRQTTMYLNPDVWRRQYSGRAFEGGNIWRWGGVGGDWVRQNFNSYPPDCDPHLGAPSISFSLSRLDGRILRDYMTVEEQL